MNSLLLLVLLIMIPIFIITIFIPYWTRKTESFGVSIPEEAYNDASIIAMRKQYVFITSLLSLIVAGLFLIIGVSYGRTESFIGVLVAIHISIYYIGSFLIYLLFHRRMKQLKANEHWSKKKSQMVVIHTKFRDHKLTFSNLWFIIALLLTIATVVITFQHYDKIPDRIPIQFNFSGEVTKWTTKSPRSVLFMPMMQVYITLLFLFVNIVISKAKQQISSENPEESIRKNIIFRRRWSGYLIITGNVLAGMFSLIQCSYIYSINETVVTTIPIVISIGLIIGALILSITTGQGGSRVKTSTTSNTDVISRDDDRYWKLGIFYFNRNDPAIFLEKRFGVGWTNNWAHPLSWLFILVIVALAIGLPILIGVL